jgi:S-formylglutathione hydrolase FrmB
VQIWLLAAQAWNSQQFSEVYSHLQEGQLKPEELVAANSLGKVALESRLQDGYDHSYYFIATFMQDHLHFHAKALGVEIM